MKRLILLLGVVVSLTAANVLFGQAKDQGVITYDVKVNMHRNLPAGAEGMKAMIPDYRTSQIQVFFNANYSITKPVIEDEDEDVNASRGGVAMKFKMPNVETHFDAATQIITAKQEFFAKEYLIIDTLKIAPWKFGTETKTIQGYICNQAYYTDESNSKRKLEITAWYTDQLRPNLGPEKYLSLPGTELAIDINNGDRTIVASSVKFKELKKNDIKVPTGGEKISSADFRKTMEEQRKKNGGGMMFRAN